MIISICDHAHVADMKGFDLARYGDQFISHSAHFHYHVIW